LALLPFCDTIPYQKQNGHSGQAYTGRFYCSWLQRKVKKKKGMLSMEKANRWVIVSNLDLSVQDGQRNHLLEFARAISKQVKTVLINTGVQNGDIDEYIPRDLDFIPISEDKVYIPILSKAHNLLKALRKVVKRSLPDVIYVRASGHYIDTIVLLYARLKRVRTVLEINGAFREEQVYMIRNLHGRKKWKMKIHSWSGLFCQMLSFRLTDRVVAVTANLKSYVNSRYGTPLQNIGVFSNGVNIDRFVPLNKETCKLNLGIHCEKCIGFVGNLSPWQGLDHLIHAIHLLGDNFSNGCLLIIGDGVEADRLRNLVHELRLNEKIKFFGKVPHGEVVTFINACDICVGVFNASKRNQLTGLSPLKIYEYLACGRPIVVPDMPDFEFVELEQVGKTFRTEDPNDLASVLADMLSLTPEQWQLMSEKARNLAVERYSWDKIAREIMTFVVGE